MLALFFANVTRYLHALYLYGIMIIHMLTHERVKLRSYLTFDQIQLQCMPCSHDTCIIKKRHVRAWLGTKLGTSNSPSGPEPENQHPIDVSELGTFPHPVDMTQTLLNSALQQTVNSVPFELTDGCRTRSPVWFIKLPSVRTDRAHRCFVSFPIRVPISGALGSALYK